MARIAPLPYEPSENRPLNLLLCMLITDFAVDIGT